MPNVGEELVGAYLRVVKECDFVQYNVSTREKQGEIDVVGINLATREAFICEVATHLVTGLQYMNMKERRPDNVNRIAKKFRSDIKYAKKYLSEFSHHFMLWSPVIKLSPAAKRSQFRDLAQIQNEVRAAHPEIVIEMIVNEVYQSCLAEMSSKALAQTEDSEFPVFRLLQIMEHLSKHVTQLKTKHKINNSTEHINKLAAELSNTISSLADNTLPDLLSDNPEDKTSSDFDL